MNPVKFLPSHFLKIIFNIILQSRPRSLSLVLRTCHVPTHLIHFDIRQKHLARNTNHEAPHHVVVSSLILVPNIPLSTLFLSSFRKLTKFHVRVRMHSITSLHLCLQALHSERKIPHSSRYQYAFNNFMHMQ